MTENIDTIIWIMVILMVIAVVISNLERMAMSLCSSTWAMLRRLYLWQVCIAHSMKGEPW